MSEHLTRETRYLLERFRRGDVYVYDLDARITHRSPQMDRYSSEYSAFRPTARHEVTFAEQSRPRDMSVFGMTYAQRLDALLETRVAQVVHTNHVWEGRRGSHCFTVTIEMDVDAHRWLEEAIVEYRSGREREFRREVQGRFVPHEPRPVRAPRPEPMRPIELEPYGANININRIAGITMDQQVERLREAMTVGFDPGAPSGDDTVDALMYVQHAIRGQRADVTIVDDPNQVMVRGLNPDGTEETDEQMRQRVRGWYRSHMPTHERPVHYVAGAAREHEAYLQMCLGLLRDIICVAAKVWWLSIDDSTKRFLMLEHDTEPRKVVDETALEKDDADVRFSLLEIHDKGVM